MALNIPDMLQELGPDTLAMLEETEDVKPSSLLTSLSFEDILCSPQHNGHQQPTPPGSFSTESSPPSLPESFASSSCSSSSSFSLASHQQGAQSQQMHQVNQRDVPFFGDVDLESEMLSDTDDFWDALVSSES